MSDNQMLLKDIILSEAEKKAHKILDSARSAEKSAAIDAEIEAQRVFDSIEARYSERIAVIKAKEESLRRSQERIRDLSDMDSIIAEVVKKAEEKLKALLLSEKGGDIISSWICESAIGVGDNVQTVLISGVFKKDESLLRAAEKKASAAGFEVSLSFGEGKLSSLGVESISSDSRISYENTVESRISRSHREIRKIVQEERCRE